MHYTLGHIYKLMSNYINLSVLNIRSFSLKVIGHSEAPDIISIWFLTGLLPEFQKTKEALFLWKDELRWY